MSTNKSPWYRKWLLERSMYGYDDLVDAILDHYVEPSIMVRCKELYDNKLMRAYVESCLLATENFEDISKTLEEEVSVLKVYHDVYYAVHYLPKIEKMMYLSKIDNTDEKNLKQWAITNGMDFIKWRLGVNTPKTELESIESLQADAYYRSKEAFFNGNSTQASSEGLKWSRQAIHLTKLIMELTNDDVQEAEDDLKLALSKLDETNSNIPSLEELINGTDE